MIEVDAEVAVLGSGFSGSLATLIANRIGLRTVLIDISHHPRFAIGESSTPIANLVLDDILNHYGLDRLVPLTAYGTWKANYPKVSCGLKRGFSFFKHDVNRPYTARIDHANELLVTANSSDEYGDTQWLRSDVDSLFLKEVKHAGIDVFEDTTISRVVCPDDEVWTLHGEKDFEALSIRADFIIDATGQAGFLRRSFGLEDNLSSFHTSSRALYTHFTGVQPWYEHFKALGGCVLDHPFPCDAAALHHVFDGAWMWVLRFDNGVTSAGLSMDMNTNPVDVSVSPEDEWRSWLKQYPSVEAQFANATLAPFTGKFIRTGRLQRSTKRVAGSNWALLPHTAGFIDPLLSTGISHTLCGIERLMRVIERFWKTDRFALELRHYEETISSELVLVDELVSGCYETLGKFNVFSLFTMLYFAAATTYEQRRLSSPSEEFERAFLCADDPDFRQVVKKGHSLLKRLFQERQRESHAVAEFTREISHLISPFNSVGLCDSRASNMYRYTGTGRRRRSDN